MVSVGVCIEGVGGGVLGTVLMGGEGELRE